MTLLCLVCVFLILRHIQECSYDIKKHRKGSRKLLTMVERLSGSRPSQAEYTLTVHCFNNHMDDMWLTASKHVLFTGYRWSHVMA